MLRRITSSDLAELARTNTGWCEGEPGCHQADLSNTDLSRMDLSSIDLREADLRRADLRKANMTFADLHGADLRGADLDFASWPLWCGGTQVKLDRHLSLQLIYHAFNQDHEDAGIRRALEALRPLAQEFIDQHHSDAPKLRS